MPSTVDSSGSTRTWWNPLSRGFIDADVRRVLAHYWRVADAHPAHILVPAVLVFVAAGLEGASFSVLIPLSEALSQNSFDFLESSKAFGWVPSLLPDAALESPRRDAYLVLTVLGLAILARAGKLFVTFGKAIFTNRRDEAYYARVQEETFARILSFGRQYFDRESLGRHDVELGWSRAVVDLVGTVEEFLKNVLNAVAKAVVMFFLSVPLFLTVVVGFPFLLKIMGRISEKIEVLAQEAAEVEVRAKRRVLDLLATVPLVKALSQERRAREAYADILEEARSVTVRKRNAMALRWPLEELFVLTTVLVVQGVIIFLSEGFVPGDLARLAAFLLLVQQILPDLKSFGTLEMELAAQRPKLKALARILSDDDKFMVASGDRTFRGLNRGIEVRDLSFSYSEGTPVLRDVSARIPAGTLTAVVGESGSGKTTFADLIGRFYECPPGSIFLDGVDIREFSLSSLYRRMAIVHQDIWLLNRTLRENLTYGLEDPPGDETLLEVLADVHLLQSIARDYEEPLEIVIGDRGVQLSGGQRQRVALARALLRSPEILILDEATSALDSAVEQQVTRAVHRRLRGQTMVVIAHRLSTVRGADRVLVFKEGRIVEEGGWSELLEADGEFRRLWDAQFEEATV